VSDDERRRQFADAFIAQARSDWQVYRLLSQTADTPVCHALHYLQMTCEKLAKAYRLRDVAANVTETISRHTGFANFIGPFFLALKDEYVGKDAQLRRLILSERTRIRIRGFFARHPELAVDGAVVVPGSRLSRPASPCFAR
jgi:hypothetical protein